MGIGGGALDIVEILTSLGAIAAHSPEVGQLFQHLKGGTDGKEKQADSGWLKKLLLAVFTTQDNAALEFHIMLLDETDDKRLIRAFIKRMRARDDSNHGQRVGSYASALFTAENIARPEETGTTTTTDGKSGKGQKGTTSPTATSTTTKTVISDAGTKNSTQVRYLKEVVSRIKTAMITAPRKTEAEAIDQIIDEMEEDGFISTESFQKRMEKIAKSFEEANVRPHLTILEALLVLGAEEYAEVESAVKETIDFPEKPDTDDEHYLAEYAKKKALYENRLADRLAEAMEKRTSLDLPKEKRIANRKKRSKDRAKVPNKYRKLYGNLALVALVAFIAFAIWSSYHP